MAKVISMEVFKKRPVLTGSIVLGGGILFYFLFMRPSGGGSGSAQSYGYTDSQVIAGGEMAALNQQAYMQGQQIQGQLAGAQIQAQTAIALANSDASLQRDLAALALQKGQMDQAVSLAGIAAERDVQMLGMQNSRDIQQMQIQGQLEAMNVQADRDIALQQMLTQAQVNIAGMTTQVQLAGIGSQERVNRASIDAQTAMNTNFMNLQAILGEQETRRRQMEIDRDIVGIRESNRTSRNASNNAMTSDIVGSVMGGIAMMSDINIKSIEGCVTTSHCLNAIEKAPVDFWKYLEGEHHDGKIHVGTYAQDFYREIGAKDWNQRDRIDVVDYMGAMTGAIKALSEARHGRE